MSFFSWVAIASLSLQKPAISNRCDTTSTMSTEKESTMSTEKGSTGAPAPAGKFKIVAKVVLAMKRFQASLNPTYQYGKRSSDGTHEEVTDSHRVIVQPKHPGSTSGRTSSGRTSSGRTLSGRPNSAGQHHGYKGNLLFRPLPEPEPVKSS